jgi:hypothetical protein
MLAGVETRLVMIATRQPEAALLTESQPTGTKLFKLR